MVSSSQAARNKSELAEALSQCRGAFGSVVAFSALINVLMLTGPLLTLQVYDRVLPSRSVPTLVALGMLMAALYFFQALLEAIRSRVLVRVGSSDAAVTLGQLGTVLTRVAAGGPINDHLAWRGTFSSSKGNGDMHNDYNRDVTYTDADRVSGRVQLLALPTSGFSARIPGRHHAAGQRNDQRPYDQSADAAHLFQRHPHQPDDRPVHAAGETLVHAERRVQSRAITSTAALTGTL